jgi:hypothetical protein
MTMRRLYALITQPLYLRYEHHSYMIRIQLSLIRIKNPQASPDDDDYCLNSEILIRKLF